MIAKILSAVALVIALTAGSARADTFAYATTRTGQFGVVDLNTGVFTESGNMGLILTGLGMVGNTLYGGGRGSSTLYSVNPQTGALTTVGSGSLTYWATGSTTSRLYAVDLNTNMNLYSIDPSTGAATLIGPTGLSPSAYVEGMSTGSHALYYTVNSSLYTLDTKNGAATLVGTSSLGLFGPTVFEHGTIYAGAAGPSAIYTLSGSDGSGTFVADVSGADTNFWGLAPYRGRPPVSEFPIFATASVSEVPIPAALPLFATGLGVLGLFGWSRKKKAQAAT